MTLATARASLVSYQIAFCLQVWIPIPVVMCSHPTGFRPTRCRSRSTTSGAAPGRLHRRDGRVRGRDGDRAVTSVGRTHRWRTSVRYQPNPRSAAHALGTACLSAATRPYSAARAAARFSYTAPRAPGPSIATAKASDAALTLSSAVSILVVDSIHSRSASTVNRVVSRSQGAMPGPTRSMTDIQGLNACARGHGIPHLVKRSVKASAASPSDGGVLRGPAIERSLR